ncbi:MAG: response regulator, partial [Gammaproteobacteria bacterium]|nr:response regulator [Gammaproteobacteria bacterium]
MNILLTEDNALIASGVVAGLTAQGFRVMHAASAAEAEALLRTLQFDAWVLDLGLPDEDGLSLLRRLRQRGVAIPVLLLTARDSVADRVSGL